jgi:hypothetical protein
MRLVSYPNMFSKDEPHKKIVIRVPRFHPLDLAYVVSSAYP